MQWSTYLVFPSGTEDFDPTTRPWFERPSPTKMISRAYYTGLSGEKVYCHKEFDLTPFPNVGKLLAGSIRNYVKGEESWSNPPVKVVESVNIFLDALSKIIMDFHKLSVSGQYTAVAVNYYDNAYSYSKSIYKTSDGSYWKPSLTDRDGLINVSIGNLSSLSDFGYGTVTMRDIEYDIFNEMTKIDVFRQNGMNNYYEFQTLEDDLIPSSVRPAKVEDSLIEVIDGVDIVYRLLETVHNAVKNLDVSNSDTGNLSELITDCHNGIEESLRKLTEQSSQLDTIVEKIDDDEMSAALSEQIQSFSSRLDTISDYYGTRIFEIEQLKVELSSFYDKAIAAWKESIESISESLTASAQAGSVALDINQALDSLKSNLKRVETLASIFDRASTVSGEISTNAQIVGTAVSTLSSLLLSFNNSVDGYEKTLLSLVENVRQNLDLFLHSSDSVFKEARKAVSDSVVTNALSKGLDLINSMKKKETL